MFLCMVPVESVRRFVAVLVEIAGISLPALEYHRILSEELFNKNYFGIYPAAPGGRVGKQ